MRVILDSPLPSIQKDRFGREPMVDLIVESINQLTVSKSHPCTIYGIYGKWGEGKTSFMNFIKEKLLSQGEKDRINLVEFNPWLVGNNGALLREFFKSIITFSENNVKKWLEKYGSLAIFSTKTIINAVKPGVGTYLAVGLNWVKKLLTNKQESLSELKKKVSQAIRESGRHLVVMIDDVDRLDKEELHVVLRLIRQVADFDNCIYIVAMDVAMVAKSIGQYHGNGSSEDGRKFLDKIVQVPITLPQIPKGLLMGLIREELTSTLSGYVADEEVESIATSVTPFISTYRELKRYCNQIAFVLPHLKNEVNIKDLCLLECIKIVNIESYRKIIENRSSLMHEVSDFAHILGTDKVHDDIRNRYEKAKIDITEGLERGQKVAMLNAIDELFNNCHVEIQNDIDLKRISTDVYFPKYFTQAVPSELIPDRELDLFKAKCQDLSIEDISRKFESWVDMYSYSEVERAVLYVIRKSKYGQERCEVTSIMVQALSCCKLAKGLPPVENTSSIPLFVSMTIYQYIFVQDVNSATMKVWDANLLDKTLSYIFSNAELNYCLNFLCLAYDIFRNGTYNSTEVLRILIQRFKGLSVEEQFGYSRLLLRTMLEYWKRFDKNLFNEYASELFTNSDISCQMVFDKFLGGSKEDDDITCFVKLFQYQISYINDRLLKESDDVRNSDSVRVYVSNYQQILKY